MSSPAERVGNESLLAIIRVDGTGAAHSVWGSAPEGLEAPLQPELVRRALGGVACACLIGTKEQHYLPVTGEEGQGKVLCLVFEAGARLAEEERAERRQRRLRALADAVASSPTEPADEAAVAQRIARVSAELVGDSSMLRVLSADGAWLDLAGAHHPDPASLQALRELHDPHRLSARVGVLARVLRTRRALLVPAVNEEVLAQLQPAGRALAERLGIHSFLVAPLLSDGEPLGVLGLARDRRTAAPFDAEDGAFVEELARRASHALVQARAARALEDSQGELRRQLTRMEALAAASRAFGERYTDLRELLQAVVQRCAQLVGDQCMIVLLSEDGRHLRTEATYAVEPELDAAFRVLIRTKELRADVPHRARLLSGEAIFVPNADPSMVPEDEPELRDLATRYGLTSVMAVPLGRSSTIGGISLARLRGSKPFTKDDLVLLQDLADRAHQAIQNARLYQAALEAARLREEFLSIASHELKTPLTSALLHLQLGQRALERDGQAPDVAGRMAAIQRPLRRLSALINGLLDVTRFQQGRLELDRGTVDLSELTEQVLGALQPDLSQAGCAVTRRLQPAVGDWDRDRLEQVLTNLLSNAIKFGAGKPISVELEANEDVARLLVRDQGLGIDAADQARIFERFERAVSDRHYGGLGLGLYIVRNVVEAHGGTITVESQPGAGACFTVTLPRRLSTAAPSERPHAV